MVLAWAVGDARTAGYLLIPHVPEAGELAVFCGAMMGACLGFLWYNCHPAQVFMGDTGSLPLGGLLGYVAICIRQELMLLIVGGVFVIEALSVMLQVGFIDDWLKLNGKGAGGSRDGLRLYQKLVFQVSRGVMRGFFLYWRAPPQNGEFFQVLTRMGKITFLTV